MWANHENGDDDDHESDGGINGFVYSTGQLVYMTHMKFAYMLLTFYNHLHIKSYIGSMGH